MFREIHYASLVIKDKDYWIIKILISTKTRDKLRTSLKIDGILKDTWNPTSLNTEIFMSIKKYFVDFIVRIISNNKYKANVDSLLCNATYYFTYNVKMIEPGQFSDPRMFHVNNFQVCISVAMEVQLQS